MNIYSNPELYDSIHKEYNWDKNMIHSYAKKVSGSVLEIASGTGRLTQTILDLGLDYTGLEISKPFLDKAKDKYKHHAKFILGDMRNFHLNNKFDFIFIGFNSFLHNLTNLDAKKCLGCIKEHLSDNGRFLLSMFVPNPSFLNRETNKLYPATDFFQFQNSRCRVMEKNQFDVKSQINNLIWYIEKNGEIDSKEYRFRMRMFYPHEMDILLSEAGLYINEKIGDYDGSSMDSESGMQIYVCQ